MNQLLTDTLKQWMSEKISTTQAHQIFADTAESANDLANACIYTVDARKYRDINHRAEFLLNSIE